MRAMMTIDYGKARERVRIGDNGLRAEMMMPQTIPRRKPLRQSTKRKKKERRRSAV
jgi:hypothetical protein